MGKLDKLKSVVNKEREDHKESEGVFLTKSEKIHILEVDCIKINPYQPRIDFNEASLNELALSIEENGLLEPILVSMDDKDEYTLIAGERRLRAIQILNQKTIKAIIFGEKVSHATLAKLALVENIERDNLHPIELAISFKNLIEKKIFENVEQLAKSINKTKSSTYKYLRLPKIENSVAIYIKDMNYRDIDILSILANKIREEEQMDVIVKIIDEKMDRKSALNYINSKIDQTKSYQKSEIFEYKTKNKSCKISIKLNDIKKDEFIELIKSLKIEYLKKYNEDIND